MGHTISIPEDLKPLAARLKGEGQSALDAHRAETLRSVQEQSAEIVRSTTAAGSWFGSIERLRLLPETETPRVPRRLDYLEAMDSRV